MYSLVCQSDISKWHVDFDVGDGHLNAITQASLHAARVLLSKGGEPRITLRCVGLEMIKREMAQEFKNLVNMRLDKTPIKVYVGQ